MTKTFPLGVYRDRTKEGVPRPAPAAPPALEDLPALLDIDHGVMETVAHPAADVDLRIRVAGFGGQGVLMLGEVLAEAGLDSGLEVSWLPSYGPEMRSGTSNCHVHISREPVDSPLVSRPNILLAMNEPSLEKFMPIVEPGGWVIYNGESLPAHVPLRSEIRFLPLPATRLADSLGEARAGNLAMLGALLEATSLLEPEAIDRALRSLVKTERWLAIDRKALETGRAAARATLGAASNPQEATHANG
jgi:2-oxoisovalerate ferredoxin oxidoreductase beta subunit